MDCTHMTVHTKVLSHLQGHGQRTFKPNKQAAHVSTRLYHPTIDRFMRFKFPLVPTLKSTTFNPLGSEPVIFDLHL